MFLLILELEISVTYNSVENYTMTVNGRDYVVAGTLNSVDDKTILECDVNGVKSSANVLRNGDSLHVFSMVG